MNVELCGALENWRNEHGAMAEASGWLLAINGKADHPLYLVASGRGELKSDLDAWLLVGERAGAGCPASTGALALLEEFSTLEYNMVMEA